MADIYQTFLRSPSAAALSSNASLHYITTTTSINEPAAILKHLQAQDKQIEKRSENILSCAESDHGVVLETETTFKFVRGGGCILPQMDDNMLADMVAVCPMVHIVQFDANRKITQIRLHWDQATMLKQVEAIGKTGRNWPIREGQLQAKLVSQSVKATGPAQEAAAPPKGSVDKNYQTRLFATGNGQEQEPAHYDTQVSTRTSARPESRDWDDFGFNGNTKSSSAQYPQSPNVRDSEQPILKSGAGKNFPSNRLFDKNARADRAPSPERKKADPTKFNHFEFSNGEDAPRREANGRPSSGKSSKHTSSWGFEDSATPEKVQQRDQKEQERHFGYGIDEDTPASPPKRPIVHAPRPDSNAHFTMTDVNSPAPEKRSEAAFNSKQPLGPITNVNNGRRGLDLNPHFNMHDRSPKTIVDGVQSENADPSLRGPQTTNINTKKLGPTKPRNEMESNLRFEETPSKDKKVYKTAGDGMGSRSGTRNWALGDDDGPEQYGGKGGVQQVYKTAGNGMGGRKDTGMLWAIGDEDDNLRPEPQSFRQNAEARARGGFKY